MISCEENNIRRILTFKIIFQLNPDGSHAYSRNNFNDSDLNRDALSLIQPESKVLMKEFYLFKPNFCFNLHGQRSIYSIGNSSIPASISFLAPCSSKNKAITKSRLLSMQLITGVCNFLKSKYGKVYGRFDDSFNLNCFGDFFSKQKVPTILFEAGHFKNDIFRGKIIEKFNQSRKERIKLLGENQSKDIEKRIFLQTIDMNWKSHIQYLEQLRQVIGLRSYGQRDPLIEYKKEAYDLFENLLNKLKLDYVTILLNLKVIEKQDEKGEMKKKADMTNNPKCLLIIKKDQKISRNDRCEATGKKFKNCCGAL